MTTLLSNQANQNPDYQSAPEAHSYPLIIKHLLDRAKVVSRDKTIHYADYLSYSYAEFFTRVNRLANMLMGLGLQKGDVVAVMDWDTHRYLECYFAIPMCGLILQTVNIRLSPDKVLYTINHAKPKALLLNAEFAPMIQDHRHDASSIAHVIWLDDSQYHGQAPSTTPDYAVGEYEALLAAASDKYDFEEFDENTIATTFYTSGTTGDPKGVFFTHRQLVLHTITEIIAASLNADGKGVRYSDVYMPMTPMFHVHAWGMPFAATMLGLKQIYPGRYQPNLLVDLIEKHNVSFTHCVPTILQMILLEMGNRGRQFQGLKMIIGGSKLTEGLAKMAVANGIEVMTGYGMSETCPILTLTVFDEHFEQLSDDEQIKHRCQSGYPIPLVALELWDDAGLAQPQDAKSTGEIVVRTPWLTQSYYKNLDAGTELWQGGFLHTQDIGHLRPDGLLQITDRLKDVIKSGGEWVSSLEIETILSLHPSVADLAVIGIPDSRWGERPLALVVRKPTHQDTQVDDILAIAEQAVEKGHIPKYAIPSRVVFVDELPKTSVGKHDKKVMRQQYLEGKFDSNA